jgi:hypothetical protein
VSWRWPWLLAAGLTACAGVPRGGEREGANGAPFVGAAAAPDDQIAAADPEAAAPASAGLPARAGGAAAPAGGPAPPPAGAPRAFPSRVASVAFEARVLPPGPGEIAGFVRDRDGKPVARACVELSGGGAARAPVFTPAEGSFRFVGVPAGLVRVTMTVANLESVDEKRIADYHRQDPNLTVMLRPLVLVPANARVEVLRVKREGDLGQGDGTRWIEVAPLALDLAGYSPACRRALEAPTRPRAK